MQEQLKQIYEDHNVPHTVQNKINAIVSIKGITEFNVGTSKLKTNIKQYHSGATEIKKQRIPKGLL
jgi:hypothetical protein